jgi:hypothetical protein
MCVGKGVDFAVQNNSFLNAFGQMPVSVAPNAVRYKIPQRDLIVPEGKIDVR